MTIRLDGLSSEDIARLKLELGLIREARDKAQKGWSDALYFNQRIVRELNQAKSDLNQAERERDEAQREVVEAPTRYEAAELEEQYQRARAEKAEAKVLSLVEAGDAMCERLTQTTALYSLCEKWVEAREAAAFEQEQKT